MNIKFLLPILIIANFAAAQIIGPPIIQSYATVSGTVSKDNGMLAIFTPIPKATVYLEMELNILYQTNANAGIGIIPPINYYLVDSAITVGNGAYSFDSVLTGNGYRLTFSKKGYQTGQAFAFINTDTVINMQLKAQTMFYTVTGNVVRDCPVCGSLLDPPLPACTVTVRFPFVFLPGPVTQAAISPLPIQLITYSAITDANGNYLIDSIPADSGVDVSDSVWVSARKSGYVPDTVKTVLHVNAKDTVNFRLLIGIVSVSNAPKSNPESGSMMRFDAATGSLRLIVDKSQSVSIQAYRADGRLIGNIISNRFLSAGTHSILINQKKTGDGIVIIKAEGENFRETLRTKSF